MSILTLTMNRALLSMFLGLGLIVNANAATVWMGPLTDFTKDDGADWMLPENQDRITENVWLTRDNTRGLFNAKTESGFDKNNPTAPADTEWAFSELNNNPSQVSASDFGGLTFSTFKNSLESDVGANILTGPGVLHLISDDIYMDITFTSWTQSGGGGFSYQRSTVVPLPPAILLLLSALVGLGFSAKRRRGSI